MPSTICSTIDYSNNRGFDTISHAETTCNKKCNGTD